MATRPKTERRTAEQLSADGFAALVDKLGMADAIRYVQLTDHGSGNYTRDRARWLESLTHTDVAGLMAKSQKKRSK